MIKNLNSLIAQFPQFAWLFSSSKGNYTYDSPGYPALATEQELMDISNFRKAIEELVLTSGFTLFWCNSKYGSMESYVTIKVDKFEALTFIIEDGGSTQRAGEIKMSLTYCESDKTPVNIEAILEELLTTIKSSYSDIYGINLTVMYSVKVETQFVYIDHFGSVVVQPSLLES